MGRMPDDNNSAQLPWLPGEQFELSFDSNEGVLTHPKVGDHVLTVTSHRAILQSQQPGKRTTCLVPMGQLSAVEVIEITRPTSRLVQGGLSLGIGVVLGLLVWLVLGPLLLILIAGGLPTILSVYLLAGYAFPDEQGELLLHSTGYSIRTPLLSANARRDAYLVAHRVSELIAAAGQREEPDSTDTDPAISTDSGLKGQGESAGPDGGTRDNAGAEQVDVAAAPLADTEPPIPPEQTSGA